MSVLLRPVDRRKSSRSLALEQDDGQGPGDFLTVALTGVNSLHLTTHENRWIGRTSVMLIPIMSNSLRSRSGGEEGGERVVGIIMVASTERVYTAGSASCVMLATTFKSRTTHPDSFHRPHAA